jgi:hypothetical protein
MITALTRPVALCRAVARKRTTKALQNRSGRSRTRTWDLFLIREDSWSHRVVSSRESSCKSAESDFRENARNDAGRKPGAPLVHPGDRLDARTCLHCPVTIWVLADGPATCKTAVGGRLTTAELHASRATEIKVVRSSSRAVTIAVSASI